jgi:PAS domain S-box-containing protein
MDKSTVANVGQWLCIAGAAIGAVGLIGWGLGAPSLTTIVPGQPAMMPNTALGCLLIGIGGALRRHEDAGWSTRVLSLLATFVVLVIGAGTLTEYAFGTDLGIDQLLHPGPTGPYPGRPSPQTALALTLLASARFVMALRRAAATRLAGWLVFGAWLISLTALLGQLFGTAELYRLSNAAVIGVAVPTAISLFLTSVGLLFERPHVGPMREATSPGPGGVLLRRLAVAAVVAPAALGFLTIRILPAFGSEEIALPVSVLVGSITAVTLLMLDSVAGKLNRTHEALESVREWASSLLDQASDGIFVADLEGRYTVVNRAGAEMLGYAPDEIVGKTIVDLIPAEEVGRLQSEKHKLLAGGIVVSAWSLRRRDGSYLPVEVSAKILPDGRWQGIVRDISERKRAELGLRRLASVLRHSSDAIMVQDLAGTILEWNRGAEQMYGYTEAEAKGMNVQVLVPEWERERRRTYLQGVQPGAPDVSFELDRRAKSGEIIRVWLTATVITGDDGTPVALGTFERDVTERRRLEDRLRLAEATSSGIISTSADAIISIDDEQRITLFNQGAEKIFGYASDEVVGAPLDILIPERFRAVHRRHVAELAAGPDASRRMGERDSTILGLRRSGEEFPADAAISKIEVDGKNVLTVALRDVTELKRIENDQRFLAETGLIFTTTLDLEEALSRVARSSVRYLADYCIVDVVTESGEIRRASVASRDPSKRWVEALFMEVPLTGRRSPALESALATRRPILLECATPGSIASLAAGEEHLRALRAAEAGSFMVLPLLAHDKVLGVITLMSSSSGRVYGPSDLALAEDLARRAAMSIQNARLYRTAERALKAREEVLGVVAHDLRNPLSTIVGQASLMQIPELANEESLRRGAEVIHRAAGRMDRLIQDLLDVSRIEAGRLTIQQAHESAEGLVSESFHAHESQARSAGVELAEEVAPALPDVWADRDRMLQVFENLIGNALKFTRPGGRITIGAERRGAEVLFRVSDTGEGIPSEDLPRLFDWFWQARAGTHGAGLGLPIVKGIVEAHGGRVWVESAPGAGSTFYFTIPTRDPSAMPAPGVPRPSRSPRRPPGSRAA